MGPSEESSSATITGAIKGGSTGSRSFSLRRPSGLGRLPVADPGREGLSIDVIAAIFDTPSQIASKWRKRFFESRLPGFDEQPHGGAWEYLAGWDVRRARVFGRFDTTTAIEPFEKLVADVMAQEADRSASRVF